MNMHPSTALLDCPACHADIAYYGDAPAGEPGSLTIPANFVAVCHCGAFYGEDDTLEVVQEARYFLREDAPVCPWCGHPSHAKACQPQRLADLLSAHATAWWRSWSEDDYVTQVNETFIAYLAAGGDDAHYDAHWRAMCDAAKEATR